MPISPSIRKNAMRVSNLVRHVDLSAPAGWTPEQELSEQVLEAARRAEARLASAERVTFARLIAKLAALEMGERAEQADAEALGALCDKASVDRNELATLIEAWRDVERGRAAVKEAEAACAKLTEVDVLHDRLRALDASIIAAVEELLRPKRVLLAEIEETEATLRRRESARGMERSLRAEHPILFP